MPHDWRELPSSVRDLEHRFVAVAVIPAVAADESHDGFDEIQGGVSCDGQWDLVDLFPNWLFLGLRTELKTPFSKLRGEASSHVRIILRSISEWDLATRLLLLNIVRKLRGER